MSCLPADKSAYARMHVATIRDILAPRIEAGEVATCSIVILEVLLGPALLPKSGEHLQSEIIAADQNFGRERPAGLDIDSRTAHGAPL